MKKIKNKVVSILRVFCKNPTNFKTIPIFINNYNRLTTLKKLIDALEKRGYKEIHILDNQSTYKPLLDFYKKTPYKVHFLKKNYGEKAFWKSGLWLKYMGGHYVYTDSDVVPVEECPEDFLEYFYNLLTKYPYVHKIGFSLKIDDLPQTFKNKRKVIDWEKKFFENSIQKNVFLAPIDTTFALYRPFSKRGNRDGKTPMLRTGFPYQARHLPWYINSNQLNEEEKFYINSLKTETHWSSKN